MRILYVHQYFATPRGRTGTRSYEQAKRMIAAGHDVLMLTSSAQLREEEIPEGKGIERRGEIDGIPCIVLVVPYHQTMSYTRRTWAFVRFMLAACRVAIREPGIDLLFATTTPLTIAVVALAARWLRGIPYVFEVRDLWPEIPLALGILKPGPISWGLGWLERTVYRNANGWIPVNEDVGEQMARTAGLRKPIAVAPNACDVQLFGPHRDGSAFRKQHQLEDVILAVHTGAMGPVNGLDHLLEAAAQLQDLERLHILIIGQGNQRPMLEERIAREGLKRVQIMDGIPKEQLADLLATADIGIVTMEALPILELNCANKFFDYLASGLPIVLNYRGWQARALERHGCGLAADQGDDAGYADQIRTLATDEELRRKMSVGARRAAETEFSRERIVDGILEMLDEIKEVP